MLLNLTRLISLLTFVAAVSMITLVQATELNLANSASDQQSPNRLGDANKTIPSLVDSQVPVTFDSDNLVVAPIPFSNPSLGSGLAGVVGYFYSQTPEQKAHQPPSASGIGVFKSSNGSLGAAIGHVAHWDKNNWIFRGALGYADLNLQLISTDFLGIDFELDWDITGVAGYAEIDRKIADHWYGGLHSIYIDLKQTFEFGISSIHFGIDSEVESIGVGADVLYDSRDLPSNAYDGYYLKAGVTKFDTYFGSDSTFDSYSLAVKGYHPAHQDLTLAWKFQGCKRDGRVPLWAACQIGLRGFPSTEYMSLQSFELETEARWRFDKRWGVAAFVGAGVQSDTLLLSFEDEVIRSYGVGVRYMIQQAERVNLRLDYARSHNNDSTIYFSVGEAF
ncbi:BamA/TamA family outer membrane protein [Colwellia sp. MEBiC06753]